MWYDCAVPPNTYSMARRTSAPHTCANAQNGETQVNTKVMTREAIALDALYKGLSDSLIASTEPLLVALGQGIKAAKQNGLSSEQKSSLATMERMRKDLITLGVSTVELDKKVSSLTGEPHTRFLEAYKAVLKPGTAESRDSIIGQVVACQFKSDMVSYRFVSVSSLEWHIYTVSPVTRTAELVLSSSDLDFTAHPDISGEITSPTRARIVCKYVHTAYTPTGKDEDAVDCGVAAVQSVFLHKFAKANAGGVGKTTVYKYGAYAILIDSHDASAWRAHVGKVGKAPRETRAQQAKQ